MACPYGDFFTADHELSLTTGMKMGDSAPSSRLKGRLFRELQAAEQVNLFSRGLLWDDCVIRFRASDPLRGGSDLAGRRTGSSTTATGQERKQGVGRKGGRSDK
jgi:hypothetical protein